MDVREEVRSLAYQYLSKVKPSGPDDIMAVCPFHRKLDGSFENNPSFAMSLSKGLYFCHSCQTSGNLYTFLKEVVGASRQQIQDGWSRLIEEARSNLPPRLDVRNPGVISFDPIPEALLGLFDYVPNELLNAGFAEETLHHFDIGFDKWNMRTTYPLRDITGQLDGISGRNHDGSYPKYKIYDTEFQRWELPARIGWDKRGILWNASNVYPRLFLEPEPSPIVVVEGFKACMWLWQSGIKDVVALMGTYMSREQRFILERLGAPVYLFLDNNQPGMTGILKAGETLSRCLPVYIMTYPERIREMEDAEAAQPDWLTPEELHESKRAAPSYFQWLAA